MKTFSTPFGLLLLYNNFNKLYKYSVPLATRFVTV